MSGQLTAEDKKIKQFISDLGEHRKIAVEVVDGNMSVGEDGIVVLTAMKNPKGMLLKMLPDVYSYSTFENHLDKDTLVFNTAESQSVLVQSDFTDFGDVLDVTKQAIAELNLYGYTVD